MSRDSRRAQAEQTLDIIARGGYTSPRGNAVDLAAAIDACRDATPSRNAAPFSAQAQAGRR